MPKPKPKKDTKSKSQIEFKLPETPPEPKPLKEDPLYFWTDIPERLSKTVPPSTPVGVENILILPFPIPETFPSLDNFEIPYVREIGIKASIETFGNHLGLTNYTFDYIQFWLLDVIVDCLWRTQDEYFFTKPEQKLVLEWILFMFRVMRDPTIFFSRKQFFKLFKEAILMTGQLIQEGHKIIPKPDDLFELVFENNRDDENEDGFDEEKTILSEETDEGESCQSESTFTISQNTSEHIILTDIGGQQRKYVLKRRICSCEQNSTPSFGTTFTTDMTKSTEISLVEESFREEEEEPFVDEEEEEQMDEEESIESFVEPFENKDYKIFHNPDPKLPSRFKPLSEDESTENLKKVEHEEKSHETPCQIIGDVLAIDSGSSMKSTTDYTSSIVSTRTDSKLYKTLTENVYAGAESKITSMSDEEKMKLWRRYKQHEQELKDMDDSNIGVVPIHHHHHIGPCGEIKREKRKPLGNTLKEETQKMLRQMLVDIEEDENEPCGLEIEYKTKNLSILCAIIDFVFDYFYQNFHFTLLKLALKTNPSILTQKINKEWSVPKQNLVELVKPKPIPKKKEKAPKKGKDKGKKDKKSKSSKDKKSKGKDKKKDKKSDKKSKDKKEKPKKLTKEELKQLKAEQEKQRLLKEQEEEEKRKAEENRRCMFPLADAANDELYMGLFENWEKPKEGKDKKDKKGKKDKKKKK